MREFMFIVAIFFFVLSMTAIKDRLDRIADVIEVHTEVLKEN